MKSSVVIEPPPRIREMGAQEVFSSGGLYQRGDIRADSITPRYDVDGETGGYEADELAPEVASNAEQVACVIEGPLAGEYTRVTLRRDKALGYTLVLRRTNGVGRAFALL